MSSSHEVVLTRTYTIPFYPKLNGIPRTKRAAKAVKILREFVARHMKSEDILIAPEVNEFIFKRGIQKPPRKITVLLEKSDDDVVEVYLADTSLERILTKKEVPVTADITEEETDEEEFEEEDED